MSDLLYRRWLRRLVLLVYCCTLLVGHLVSIIHLQFRTAIRIATLLWHRIGLLQSSTACIPFMVSMRRVNFPTI